MNFAIGTDNARLLHPQALRRIIRTDWGATLRAWVVRPKAKFKELSLLFNLIASGTQVGDTLKLPRLMHSHAEIIPL